LASILCAKFWQEQIINAKGFSRALNILWGLHLFVFFILMVVLLAISFLPFGTISIVGILDILALLMLLILIIKSAQSKGMKWWYMSIVIMIGVNTIMDTHFYPHLLQYQWGNSFAKTIVQNGQ
jgi:hypothetical protein